MKKSVFGRGLKITVCVAMILMLCMGSVLTSHAAIIETSITASHMVCDDGSIVGQWVRSSPGMGNNIIEGSQVAGSPVEILDISANGRWFLVNVISRSPLVGWDDEFRIVVTGWMYGKYLVELDGLVGITFTYEVPDEWLYAFE